MSGNSRHCKKRITVLGLISVSLLLIAKVIAWLHLPNCALFIVAGILIFNMAELPLFLVCQNRAKPLSRTRHWLMFCSSFLFNIGYFFVLQQDFVPLLSALAVSVLAGIYLVWYFYSEVRIAQQSFRKSTFLHLYIIFLGLLAINVPIELQAPDYLYKPTVQSPVYPDGDGPVIFFDEAHNNIHTLNDRLIITGLLLEDDGYEVRALNTEIKTGKELESCNILLIVNALHNLNLKVWKNPTYSAFTEVEVVNISDWVFGGGSLLLIVDHMPIPGAAYDLARAFGFELRNGHVQQIPWNDNWFVRNDFSLSENVITNGRSDAEFVDSVLVYGGSAFLIPRDATSILELDTAYYQWEPEVAWELRREDRYSAAGFSMGAFKQYGKGKVVIYSEAMMFTAQLGGGLSWIKLGMNSKEHPENAQLLLNTIHWLDGQMNH